MSSSTTTNKNYSKKSNSCRDRDKNKSLASESGGSSQCDTPPLTEKEGAAGAGVGVGRYAGVGADSVVCAAEQVGLGAGGGAGAMDLSTDAAATLAEDVSYKLRQLITTVALSASLSKRNRVCGADVRAGIARGDVAPHAAPPHHAACLRLPSPHQSLHAPMETGVRVRSAALEPLVCGLVTPPSLTTEWVVPTPAAAAASHHYYTKIARAVLCGGAAARALALAHAGSTRRLGLVLANLVNLAVLVLNEDNLHALHVPAKRPLQRRVLRLLTALAQNPCARDTALAQQFQRLFPVMVSAVLGGGELAPDMLAALATVTRVSQVFQHIGVMMLGEYISGGAGGADGGTRLTAGALHVAAALGRSGAVTLLARHLDVLDTRAMIHPATRNAMLEVMAVVMRAERSTALEDLVTTDYAMYELLGDSVAPHRRLMSSTPPSPSPSPKHTARTESRGPCWRVRRLPVSAVLARTPRPPRDVFEVAVAASRPYPPVCIVVRGCRSRPAGQLPRHPAAPAPPRRPVPPRPAPVMVASARLARFRFRPRVAAHFPLYGALQL